MASQPLHSGGFLVDAEIVHEPLARVGVEAGANAGNSRGFGVIQFGTFALDEGRRHLLRDGAPIHLTPKAFELLSLLLASAPRVVTKRELHEQLWPQTHVSDATLVGLVKEIRRALDDHDPDAPIIRTLHRVGYACCLDVSRGSPRGRVWHWLVFHGRRLALHDGRNIVGRDPNCDVCLDSSAVSRRHAQITINGPEAQLEELGSKNGTTVSGRGVDRPAVLSDGDRVAFGAVVGVYRTSGSGLSTETHVRDTAHESVARSARPDATKGRRG